MSNQNFENNGVNGTRPLGEGSSPGRCFLVQQREPGRHQVTARMKWNKEVNKAVMECFYRSKPFDEEGKPVRGYRQRIFREWRDRGLFESTEQRVYDQARAIRKNGWLSQLELEAIKRQVEDEFQGEFGEDDPTEVETVENEDTAENEAMIENEVESVAEEIVNVEEVNNNVTGSVDDTRHTLNDEHRKIVERLNEIMLEGKTSDGIMFKKVDKKTLKVQTDRVNEAIRYFQSKNITETNDLIKASSVWVAEQIGLKKIDYREKNKPRWKGRIEEDIKKLRQEVNLLTRDLKGELGPKKKQKMKELYGKYRVKKKGLKTVIEEVKQRMLAKIAKVKGYEQRIEQFRQNRIFDLDQKKIYAELYGNGIISNGVPNAEECTQFWGNIWGVRKEHNREAEWLKDLKREKERE